MLVTDDGISTLVNPLQPENALVPMLVRPVVWDKSRWILADSPAAVSVASKVLMVEEVIAPVTTTLYSPLILDKSNVETVSAVTIFPRAHFA